MERRELLRRGALLGSFLVAERLADPEPAAATGLRVLFLEGDLQTEEGTGWTLWLSITGKRAQGFAFDPETVEGGLQALRFEGRLQNHRLRMNVFALEDVNFTEALGSLRGGWWRGGLAGTVTFKDKSEGRFQTTVIPISLKDSLALVGIYRGTARDTEDDPLYSADLRLRADLTWELRNIRALAPGVPALAGGAARRLAGRFAVAEDGRLLVNMTRVPLKFRTPPSQRRTVVHAQPGPASGTVATPSCAPAPGQEGLPVAAGRAGKGGQVGGAGVDVDFNDATFADADWKLHKIIDTTRGMLGFAEGFQNSTGGNSGTAPDPFRRIVHGYGKGDLFIGHLHNHFLYSPAANGAIGSIDHAYDLIHINPPPDQAVAYGLLLRQGDTDYSGPRDQIFPEAWQHLSRTGLRAADFTKLAGTGPIHPDFSSAGGQIRFGFLSANTGTQDVQSTRQSGIDDFSVTVHPADGSGLSQVDIDGPGATFAGTEVCFTATATDVAGLPLRGVRLLFSVSAPNRQGPVPKVTDADGRAQFCFRPDSPGLTTIGVFLDSNGDGDLDPGEPGDDAILDVKLRPGFLGIDGPTSASLPGNAGEIQVCYTATLTDLVNHPLPGESVKFTAQASGETTVSAVVVTDASGHAGFCFSVSEPATWIIIASWRSLSASISLDLRVEGGFCTACCTLVGVATVSVFHEEGICADHPTSKALGCVKPVGP